MTIDVINAVRIRIFLRICLGLTPVDTAKSSPPNDNALRSQDHLSAVGSNPITATLIQRTFTRFGLERLPKDQWASCDSCSSVAKYCNTDTIAPEMKVIAIPIRIYDSAEIVFISPNLIIMNTTIKENKKAFATIANSGMLTTEKPTTIAKADPSAAPEDTPNVKGETNGLPKQPCMRAPAVAKAIPPIIAINILGNLSSQMMLDCSLSGSSIPKMIFAVFHISKLEEEPWPMAMIESNIVKTLRMIIDMICFLASSMCLDANESMALTTK